MKKLLVVIVVAGLLIVTGYIFYNYGFKTTSPTNTTPQPTAVLVGGDRDTHGCIGSAGYVWCEPKNKCLRDWEEKCFTDTESEIQYLLAKKYNKELSEVKVTLTKEESDFASGSVMFGLGGPGEGGIFLARKTGVFWELNYDGNGSIDCVQMRSLGFPDTILKPNFCD